MHLGILGKKSIPKDEKTAGAKIRRVGATRRPRKRIRMRAEDDREKAPGGKLRGSGGEVL